MARSPQLVGQTLGHYRILEQIGAGGMGVVYRAHDERLERDVAVKVLPPGVLADVDARKRFRKEALILSKLSHPNIAMVFDFDTQQGTDFLVTEYIPGTTLDAGSGRALLPEKEGVRLGLQLAEGLAAAHEQGVIHRDLKPSNLRVTPDGRLKILDFGIAKLLPGADQTPTQTRTEAQGITGTVPYMSPEQLKGEAIDARADIYAAGVVLYEMTTGGRPFEAKTSTALAADIIHKPPLPPRQVNPKVSPKLEDIILKCLEKEPENRYQSAKELAVDLRRMTTSTSSTDVSVPVRAGKEWVWAFAIVCAAALTTLILMFSWNVGGLRERLLRTPGHTIRSIAVLPFANSSKEPEMDYLGEGLSEEITNSLSRLPNLKVMAITTVLRYKSRQGDPQGVGQDLRVDAVLAGRVAEHGDEINIETELVDVVTGAQLWGERYTRKASDASLLQTAITSDIASQLRPQITRKERENVARVGTGDAEAYQLYLKGRYHASKSTEEGLRKGIEYFQQAIERDPEYALAYAALADCYIDLAGNTGYLPQSNIYHYAEAAATKALEIDDTLADAHSAFGSVKAIYKWDWAGAEREFKRAIALNPSSADAHGRYAQYLRYVGRFQEGLNEDKRAQDLDPLSPTWAANSCYGYVAAQRYDDSILRCKNALELEPNVMWVHAVLAWAYARKGNHSQAIAEYEKLGPQGYAVLAENQLIAGGLGWVYAVAGRRRDAISVLARFNTLPTQSVDSYWVAAIYAGLGDKDRAFELLEKGFRQHSGNLTYLKPDPFWDSLRSDPRYADLLRRMGLPQ